MFGGGRVKARPPLVSSHHAPRDDAPDCTCDPQIRDRAHHAERDGYSVMATKNGR